MGSGGTRTELRPYLTILADRMAPWARLALRACLWHPLMRSFTACCAPMAQLRASNFDFKQVKVGKIKIATVRIATPRARSRSPRAVVINARWLQSELVWAQPISAMR